MFQSQLFLSKKGPLGSIWVAAYCLKRLHRDQIVQTNIPSSVDKILMDEWPTVTYRVLAYLLLGVVRIYSKKVEFVLHDCREIINELNKFVGKKKAVSFREIVHPQDFSVTLPERYELDAFVLEYADDGNKAHVAKKEDIIIQGSCRNDKSVNCSVKKCHKNVSAQGRTTPIVSKKSAATIKLKPCSSAQNPLESPEDMEIHSFPLAFVENCMEFELGTSSSQLVRSFEESIEEFRETRFSREECLDFEMFYQNDKEHVGIFKSPIIIQSANVEHTELITVMQTENNDNLHSEAEEETRTVERNPYSDMPSDNHDHVAIEEKEANFTVQTSSLDSSMPSNNHKIFAVEEEGNFIDRSLDLEIASEDQKNVNTAKKVIIADLERASQSDTFAPVTFEKEKIPLKVQTTPDLKIPDLKEPGSISLLAVRTPANKESVRTANKRKCVYDDFTVLSNQTLKHNIDDPSDLVRKRRRVPHRSLAVWKQSCIYDLLQKFMEPLIPCNMTTTGIVIDPKDIRVKSNDVDRVETVEAPAGPMMAADVDRVETVEAHANPVMAVDIDRVETVEAPANPVMAVDVDRVESVEAPANPVMAVDVDRVETVEAPANPVMAVDVDRVGTVEAPANPVMAVDVDRVETVEAPANPVMAVSPPRSVADGGLSAIAPGTPVRCSTSTRAFITPTAGDSDGEGPSVSFQTVRKENPGQSYENARKDFAADSVEEIALDLMDEDMDGNVDSQKQDGWSTRTRTIARWLHQVFASKTMCNEVKTANLSQLVDGKMRKESARVFYEILVLGSGDYVNVSQEGAYKDILLQETRKMERKLAKYAV